MNCKRKTIFANEIGTIYITTRNISSRRETIIRTSRRLMICQMDFCGRVEYFYKRVIRSYHH